MKALAVISMSALALLSTSAARAQTSPGSRSRAAHFFSTPRWHQLNRAVQGVGAAALQAANPTPIPNPTPNNRVTYHGGPVMQGYKAYTIFWAPAPHSIPSSYRALINRGVRPGRARCRTAPKRGNDSPAADTHPIRLW